MGMKERVMMGKVMRVKAMKERVMKNQEECNFVIIYTQLGILS